MKKTNYHTHTKRCMHAEGTEADYVKAALNACLDVLGFSDHGPFPDNRLTPACPMPTSTNILHVWMHCARPFPSRS